MSLMINAEELKPLSEAVQAARHAWSAAAKASLPELLKILDSEASTDELERMNALVQSLKDEYHAAARTLADAVNYEIGRSEIAEEMAAHESAAS
ncbi:hypothetical protein P2W50_31170 [Pseudomonas protegens]|uniref:hypothetical protein n=1 Tax=Pseudomonas protegens TaxID=380021 RepID=UPI0023EB3A5E|nr:hypothetical protein [Pseudomonas protegens]MDF4211114.1 hypothetical protein [Pseudomonas protegens]